MKDKYFRRRVKASSRDPGILVDSELEDKSYVESFGFEWTEIDGFVGERIYVTRTYFWPVFVTKLFHG